jgi:S-formylglutathione hydrolase FrmB
MSSTFLRRMRPRLVIVLLLVTALAAPAALPLHRAVAATAASGGGLRLHSIERRNDRLLVVSVVSPAMRRLMRVRVLLPAGYAQSDRRYPVLYLHHGGGGDERRWTTKTRIQRHTEGRDVIVVMPAANYVNKDTEVLGWFSDWLSGPRGNNWETYHLDELIPFIDGQFRTIPSRRGRAIAGLSMGGYGSLAYASRRPDLFAAAASFAGLPDTVMGDTPAGEAIAGADVWGSYATQEVRHRGHNPRDLLTNLRGVDLYLTAGSGIDTTNPEAWAQDDPDKTVSEPAIMAANQAFSSALTDAGIPHQFHVREGNHTWRYWDRDVREWLPHVLKVLRGARAVHQPPAYRSADRTFEVWGWRVDTNNRPLEFLEVRRFSRSGFTALGSGVISVATPPYYKAGTVKRIRVGSATHIVRVGRNGRLRFDVNLGAAHAHQQFTPEADAQQAVSGASYFRQRSIRIANR